MTWDSVSCGTVRYSGAPVQAKKQGGNQYVCIDFVINLQVFDLSHLMCCISWWYGNSQSSQRYHCSCSNVFPTICLVAERFKDRLASYRGQKSLLLSRGMKIGNRRKSVIMVRVGRSNERGRAMAIDGNGNRWQWHRHGHVFGVVVAGEQVLAISLSLFCHSLYTVHDIIKLSSHFILQRQLILHLGTCSILWEWRQNRSSIQQIPYNNLLHS